MKGFYMALDAALDTREGTIKRLHPDIMPSLVQSKYHKRKGDFFEGVDEKAYKELYAKRDIDTLMQSTVTNIFQFLYPQVLDHMKETLASEVPNHQKPMLDLNVWPYELTIEEKAMLRSLVYGKMRGIIGVNVIDVPLKDLTPAKCSENYLMMVMYDYHDYLNAHSDALLKHPRPLLMIIAPMVYFNVDPDVDEEAKEQLKHGINSLAILEAAIAPRIGLRFINIENYSIIYPDDRIVKIDEPDVSHFRSIEDVDRELARRKQATSSELPSDL